MDLFVVCKCGVAGTFRIYSFSNTDFVKLVNLLNFWPPLGFGRNKTRTFDLYCKNQNGTRNKPLSTVFFFENRGKKILKPNRVTEFSFYKKTVTGLFR